MALDQSPRTDLAKGDGRALVYEPSPIDRDPGKFARRRKLVEFTAALLFPIGILLLWQVGSVNGWWDRVFYPAPSDIYSQAITRFQDFDLWGDIRATMKRAGWGYFWGVIFGLFAAFFLGKVRFLRKMTEPTLNALYTVPKITLISPFLVIFGFKDTPIIVLIAITVFFFVWVPVQHAVMTVPASQIEAAKSFGSSPLQELRHVTLPAVLPQIFVQLRVAASVALLAVFGFEAVYTPASKGLGFMIINTKNAIDNKSAFAGIVIAALLGVIASGLIGFIGKKLTPWSDEASQRS